MPISHKFKTTDWGNGFETNNAILDVTPYEPEVLILGTFNPDTPNANHADFFYGRNFFWSALKNIFVYKEIVIGSRRMNPNGAPPPILNPTLEEIFEMCISLKLTFSDLVLEVLHSGNPVYDLMMNDNVIYQGNEYNLIQDGTVNAVGGLAQLNNLSQVSWNSKNIISYLISNPSVKQIYFTRRPTGVWLEQWNHIRSHPLLKERLFTNIFTPSGAGAPVYRVMERLVNHWIHNNNPNFGNLDINWLIRNNVNTLNF